MEMALRACTTKPMLSTKSPPSRTLYTRPQDQHWEGGKLEDMQGPEGWRSTSGARGAAVARLDIFLWSRKQKCRLIFQLIWRFQPPAKRWQPWRTR